MESVKKELAEYERINNPIIMFIEENKVYYEPVQAVYNKYSLWCHNGGMKPVNINKFTREINEKGFATKQIRVTKNMDIKGFKPGDRVQVFVNN